MEGKRKMAVGVRRLTKQAVQSLTLENDEKVLAKGKKEDLKTKKKQPQQVAQRRSIQQPREREMEVSSGSDDDDDDEGEDDDHQKDDDADDMSTSNQEGDDDIFAPVRHLYNSALLQHKQTLAVLSSIEEVVAEKKLQGNPTAYFGALMVFLEKELPSTNPEHEQTISGCWLLMSLILLRLNSAVLQSKSASLVQFLNASLEKYASNTSLARAAAECINIILLSQPRSAHQSIWNSVVVLLTFSMDHRPKVRKKAITSLSTILETTSQDPSHPVRVLASSFCLRHLEQCSKSNPQEAIHIVGLIDIVMPFLPHNHLKVILEQLVKLFLFGQVMLSMRLFYAIEHLFQREEADFGSDATFANNLLTDLLELRPDLNDSQLMIPWIKAFTSGCKRVYKLDANVAINKLSNWINIAAPIFATDKDNIATEVLTTLLELIDMIDENMIENTVSLVETSKQSNRTANSPLETIISIVESLLSYKYQQHWHLCLLVIQNMFEKLGNRVVPLMTRVVLQLDELYRSDEFQLKKELTDTLHVAVRNMGPDVTLQLLPLNILAQLTGNYQEVTRPWLLPLLKDSISHANFSYFVKTLYPLAQQLHKRSIDLNRNAKEQYGSKTAKMLEALYIQIWSLFPGFCTFPIGYASEMNHFAKELGALFNNDSLIRPMICQGFNQAVITSSAMIEDPKWEKEGKENVQVLKKFAKNFWPIFFNVFGSLPVDNRNYIADTIRNYATIAEPQLINLSFKNTVKHLLEGTDAADPDISAKRHTMMDLTLCMVEYLLRDNLELLMRVIRPQLEDSDQTLQKKSYKALLLMFKNPNLPPSLSPSGDNLEELKALFVETVPKTANAAKKERLKCLHFIVENIKDVTNSKDFFLGVLPEIILATKEVNEKSRNAAFDLLVAIGRKMEEVPQGIDDFFSMVVAGLAGTSSHMIAATVSSLSRILFEFHGLLQSSSINTLIATNLILLQSKSREIIKSSLGFFKVCLAVLQPEAIGPHIPDLVENLLLWANEHHHRFNQKVKHLLQRLIKKFTYELIVDLIPPDHQKLITYVRKQMIRTKKQKHKEKDKNFDQTMEDSSDSEDEELPSQLKEQLRGSKSAKGGSSLLESKDDTLDFLDRKVMSKVVATKNGRISGKKGAKEDDMDVDEGLFPTSEDGRFVIDEDEDEKSEFNKTMDWNRDSKSRNSSKSRLTQLSKFSKASSKAGGGLKRRHDGEDDFDIYSNSSDEDDSRFDNVQKWSNKSEQRAAKRQKPTTTVPGLRLGEQYKSKKGQGDIKREGKLDPYAYVPLSHSTLSKRKKNKAVGEMKGVLQAAMRGSAKGKKAFARGHKKRPNFKK